MEFKKKLKSFQRAMARYGLYTFSWSLKWLPYWAVNVLTKIFVPIAFIFTVKQKRIARESLEIAFSHQKSPEEIEGIVKKCFYSFGRGMIEMFYYMSHPKAVSQNVSIEGEHYLKEAQQEGKGVIAVTAHFGNFPLMMLYFALQGYKANAIIRPARDKNLEEYLLRKRTESGLNTVYALPRNKCVEESLKALRENELLFIPLDQNFGSASGVFVDFFGQKAATATGPVVFARRTKAQIIPMFIVRDGIDRHKIIIEPPIKLEEKETDQETLQVNTTKITKLIEQYIRRYPHEWGWMHRRWKSRPDEIFNRTAKA